MTSSPEDPPGAQPGASPDRVAVGHANAPWGVRGHVKVTPLTNNPERLAAGAILYVDGVQRRIVDARRPSGYPVVQFEGITDRQGAESLRDALIEIDEAELPALPEDEYYVHDLIGLRVITSAGDEVGVLEDILQTGSNDVYVVRRPGQSDQLVHAIDGVVGDIDLDEGTVMIEPVLGLLD